jgi:hypothetical protein
LHEKSIALPGSCQVVSNTEFLARLIRVLTIAITIPAALAIAVVSLRRHSNVILISIGIVDATARRQI